MNWPNRISLIRLLTVPVLIIAIVYRNPEHVYMRHVPLIIFLFASFLDGLDGYLARRHHLKTELGAFLDPLADKTLILATFLTLHFSATYMIKMPVWVLVIIASRDTIIVMWLIVSYMNHLEIKIRPNFLGKMTTCAQMVTIGGLMIEATWVAYLWWITAVFTILSAASYIWRETRKLQEVTVE